MNNVTKIEPPAQVPQTLGPTPTHLLDRAVAQGASVEVLEKLMGLQERYESNMARRAFDNAMAAAKSNMPVIVKSREMNAGAGRTAYKFEDMAAISKAVDPVLAEQGLSYRFRTQSGEGTVTVTCIISHRGGHSEENSLTSGFDTSGSKNTIQSLGSAVTYLSRYTLKAALGLAASADTDASDVDLEAITEQQVDEITKLATEVKADIPKFCEYMKFKSLKEIPASRLNEAKAALELKRPKK